MIDASDCMRLRVQMIVLDDEIIETRTGELVTGIDWKLRNFRDFVVESMFEVKSPIITVGSSLVRICVVLKCVDGEKVEASFLRVDHHRGEAVLLLLAAAIGDDIPQHLPASFAWRVPSDYHLPWMEEMIDVSRLLDARDGLLTDDGVLSVKLLVGIPDERLETAPSGLFDKCFTWRLRRLKHMKDLMGIFCQTGREIPSECTFFDPPTDENMVQLVLKPLDYETYEFRLVFLFGSKESHCAMYKLEIDSLPNIVQKAMEFDSQVARSEPISLTTSSSVVNVRAWVKLISKPDFDRIMLSDEDVRGLKKEEESRYGIELLEFKMKQQEADYKTLEKESEQMYKELHKKDKIVEGLNKNISLLEAEKNSLEDKLALMDKEKQGFNTLLVEQRDSLVHALKEKVAEKELLEIRYASLEEDRNSLISQKKELDDVLKQKISEHKSLQEAYKTLEKERDSLSEVLYKTNFEYKSLEAKMGIDLIEHNETREQLEKLKIEFEEYKVNSEIIKKAGIVEIEQLQKKAIMKVEALRMAREAFAKAGQAYIAAGDDLEATAGEVLSQNRRLELDAINAKQDKWFLN